MVYAICFYKAILIIGRPPQIIGNCNGHPHFDLI